VPVSNRHGAGHLSPKGREKAMYAVKDKVKFTSQFGTVLGVVVKGYAPIGCIRVQVTSRTNKYYPKGSLYIFDATSPRLKKRG
jgi:hypothetical protein